MQGFPIFGRRAGMTVAHGADKEEEEKPVSTSPSILKVDEAPYGATYSFTTLAV